jgi:hypothetical protein
MIGSPEVRKLRKKQQLALLAAKAKAAETGDWAAYSAFFASQGIEQAKSAHNAKITAARGLVRSSKDAIAMAQVTGEGIGAAFAAHTTATATLAALRKQKDVLFKPMTSANLTAGAA